MQRKSKLSERLNSLELPFSHVKDTIERLKSRDNIYIFGAGERAICLANFLQKNGVYVQGFLVNQGYFEQSVTRNRALIPTYCYEEKSEDGSTLTIVLAVSKSRLNMEQFDCATVQEVVDISMGVSDDYLISEETYQEHMDDLDWLYETLEDVYSKEALFVNLQGRLTGKDIPFPPSAWNEPQYFLPEFVEWREEEVLMDGGAFTGDTVEEFLQKKSKRVSHYKVFAWEPDPKNYNILKNNYANNSHVVPVEKGMFSFEGELCFSSDSRNGESSYISDRGDVRVAVTTIDSVAGENNVTFIKMDIEGSELEALKGARKQIIKNTPRLAVCLYHKQEDMWTIPQYILRINPNYRVYLRTHFSMPTELVLFCLPKTENAPN